MEILDFAVANGVNGVDFGGLGIDALFFGGLMFDNNEYSLFANVVESAPVSAPSVLFLMSLSMAGFVLARRKNT